jgi:hypothetical protein
LATVVVLAVADVGALSTGVLVTAATVCCWPFVVVGNCWVMMEGTAKYKNSKLQ